MASLLKMSLVLLLASHLSCEADSMSNPKPSDIENFSGSGSSIGTGDAEGGVPVGEEAVAYTPLSPGEETAEGVVLYVRPAEDLPNKIKECAVGAVAGEVIDGEFRCNTQSLVDCLTELSEPQKAATLKYANDKLRTYSLWGCSIDAASDLAVHFYTIEGQSLKIFNLAVRKASSEPEAALTR